MDATTVQEVANQLHIGVNEVAQYIPTYAQAQIAGCIIWIVTFAILIVVSGILAITFFVKEIKWDNVNDSCSYNDEDKAIRHKSYKLSLFYNKAKVVALWVFGFSCVVGIVIFIYYGSFIYQWSMAPELTLLMELI